MVNLPGKQLIILDVLQANKLACLQNGKWDLNNKRNNCSRVANSQESNKQWLTDEQLQNKEITLVWLL